MTRIICAHAGAWNTNDEIAIATELKAVDDAVSEGIAKEDIMEGVLETVKFLEDHPSLDAGTGSILQMDGVARTDAAVATNSTKYEKKYAGILQLRGVKNPCLVAKKILDYGYHSVLSGDHALQFAQDEGFVLSDLVTPARKKAYENQLQFLKVTKTPSYKILAERKKELDEKKLSTVGAVGVDTEKKIMVSVTSTGGLYYGFPGRVGDTGIFGHGIFCDENVAVACTGEGDKMMQRMTASKVGFFYEKNKDIQQSVALAVQDLKEKQNGECGIIALDLHGNVGISKSTSFLAVNVQTTE